MDGGNRVDVSGVSADSASIMGGRGSRSLFLTFAAYLAVSTSGITPGPGDPV